MEKGFREIMVKKPWGRIAPDSSYALRTPQRLDDVNTSAYDNHPPLYKIVTQADFLREYYPSGHLVQDENYYPDIYREEEVEVLDDNGDVIGTRTNRYVEHVPRYSFAFQKIISVKHLIHLCGNDIQWDMTKRDISKKEEDDIYEFKSGWLKKHMEIAFYEAMKSCKIVGDGAIVGYIKNGCFGWTELSYINGDTLYPHFGLDGELELFARSFTDYDENGVAITKWLEVWDENYLYRYRQGTTGAEGAINKIKEFFGLDGYELVSKEHHGFSFIPVAYKRVEEGACWSASQDSIDGYELAYSEMAQNNHAFGTPTMYLQGENVETMRDMNGSLKVITMGKDDKAGYLEGQSASESYQRQLDICYKLIYKQSHAVETPQIGGNSDISGAAIKILYADATEQATIDANECQTFISTLAHIFAFGYGLEMNKLLDYTSIPLSPWIKPFVHVNESAIIDDLAKAVGSGFISKQTASERASFYTDENEFDRIIKEAKNEQESDLLYQIEMTKNSQQNNEGDSNKNNEGGEQ